MEADSFVNGNAEMCVVVRETLSSHHLRIAHGAEKRIWRQYRKRRSRLITVDQHVGGKDSDWRAHTRIGLWQWTRRSRLITASTVSPIQRCLQSLWSA
jgi:hypothetical protein